MQNFFRIFISITFFGAMLSCANDLSEVDKMFDKSALMTETAKNVELFYSDSSIVKVKVIGETLVRHINKEEPLDEFPDGVFVEFYDDFGRVSSWMSANYAIRFEKSGIIIAERQVELYNKQNEKLETNELIWNDSFQKLYTEKFVQITQPLKQDTIQGFGFEANEDFSHFKIKRKFTARTNIEGLYDAIENAKPQNQ
jgi:LPS export ABC transporter protein LptC